MNQYIIYMYTSPSGKRYIGQTKNFKNRERQHKYSGSKCSAFANAIKKYGYANLKLEILEVSLTIEEANIKEEYYIDKYSSLAPNGYNLQTGGYNFSISEETREKFKIANKKRIVSSETKQKQSNYWKLNTPIGENNIKSKKYIITFPNGEKESIICLKQFCEKYNLHAGHMSAVAKGNRKQHKNFKCEYNF